MGFWTKKSLPAVEPSISKEEVKTAVPEIVVAPPSNTAWPRMSTFQSVTLTLNLTLAMTMNIMSAQSAVIALPSIMKDLDIMASNGQWILSAYSLTFGCALLLAGRLSDLWGHKLVFTVGTSWFAIWSVGCGFAKTEIALDMMRAMQGFGAAASIPSAMGIIATSFPPGPSKSTAFATFSAGAAFGGSLGTIFGGVLTTYAPAGWRAIYYTSAGLAAGITICGYFVIPNTSTHHNGDRSVDWIGAALVTGGLVLLTFVLADGEGAPNGWKTPYIPVMLVLAFFALGAFLLWEHHLEHRTNRTPLMRLSMFKKGRFAVIQVLAAFGWSCFVAHQYLVTLYYQEYLKLTPLETTVRFLPMSVTGLCLNFIVAMVAARAPAQLLISVGALGTALAPLLFAIMPPDSIYWSYQFPAQILTVFGADFIFACGIMLCSGWAGRDEQGLSGGIFNTLTQIGAAVGLAIMTIIQTRVTKAETEKLGGVYNANDSSSVPPEALLKGLRAAFFGCASFGIACLIIALIFLRGVGTVGEKPEAPESPVEAMSPVSDEEKDLA